MTMGVRRYEFPPAHYIVLQHLFDNSPSRDERIDARLRLFQLHTYLELLLPAVQAELLFDDYMTGPNVFLFEPDGPLTLRAAPAISVEKVGEEVLRADAMVNSAPDSRRGRVALACRWFLRGMQENNPTDKIVYFCIALEVLFEYGNFVAKLRDALTAAIPGTTQEQVSTALDLGRIYGMRGDVVHKGVAYLSESEFFAKSTLLEKAEAVTRAALLLEAGLPLGDTLTNWLPTSAATASTY